MSNAMPPKIFKYFILIYIGSLIYLIWLNFSNNMEVMEDSRHRMKNIYKIYKSDLRLNKKIHYRRNRKIKYILVWPSNNYLPFSAMLHGHEDFIRLRCPVTNCYVTSNRTFFQDIRDFDVIAFMGMDLSEHDLPRKRARYQKYIYFNMESSAMYPVADEVFDEFFNGTATYRLDSDIPLPHLLIRDTQGYEVGPKRDMSWVNQEDVDNDTVLDIILKDKSRIAAIFSSDCLKQDFLGPKEDLLAKLQNELEALGYEIDVYGSCGNFECSSMVECYKKWKKEYFFYLAFENSLDKDYVTDTLLIPLQNDMVPIVNGGANYSRFLPPGSYLHAMASPPKELAKKMVDIISSTDNYQKYFWWKKFYTYHNPKTHENLCNICASITNKKLWKTQKIHKKFRDWWNINYTAFGI